MRTNTWLGLIFLNQMTQVLQADRIAHAQKVRDEARDAMFAKAHEAAQRGQFAMWIQTPDGQRFERWSQHALEASRAIDDRQVAWDLAWEQDLQERREAARPAALVEAEASTPSLPAGQEKDLKVFGLVMSAVTLVLGTLWIVLVVTAPEAAAGESSLTPGSVIAFVLTAVAGVLAVLSFIAMGADERRSSAVAQKVETTISQNVLPASFSWHDNADDDYLEERQKRIARTVETAAEKFPRGGKLAHLRGVYDTRPADPDDGTAPESIQRLLEAFREQDRERLAALERDGIA